MTLRWMAAAAIALACMTAAHARTLAEVKARGVISVCANPDALPFATSKGPEPGFQLEIAQAVARGMGVRLEPLWIMPRIRANLVDCDMLMDSIADPALYEGRLLLTRPYQRTGVALAVGAAGATVQGFDTLPPGKPVGVMVGSLAQAVLGKRGIAATPYAFERDMLTDLAGGALYAAAASPATIGYFIRTNPDKGLRLVHAYQGEPQLAWNVAVGLRKSDAALVGEVDRVLAQLAADGGLAAIYARYGVEYRAP
jgi:polar amino acid transport system substrate-binding protein